MHCICAAHIKSHSLEPCTLAITYSEPEAATAVTVDPSGVNESMAEEESSGSSVQQASSDERLSDSEKQQQQVEDPSETSPVLETPGKHPAYIERCSSLDDVKLTKQKVTRTCSYTCWENLFVPVVVKAI